MNEARQDSTPQPNPNSTETALESGSEPQLIKAREKFLALLALQDTYAAEFKKFWQ